jgi:hypothetical protein
MRHKNAMLGGSFIPKIGFIRITVATTACMFAPQRGQLASFVEAEIDVWDFDPRFCRFKFHSCRDLLLDPSCTES